MNPRESSPEHYSKIKNLGVESKKLPREEKSPIGLEKYKQKQIDFVIDKIKIKEYWNKA